MSLRAGQGCRNLRDDRTVREDEGVERLRRELSAEEDIFLLGLRGDRIEWEKAAFTRFEQALRWACTATGRHTRTSRGPDRSSITTTASNA